MGLFKEKNCAHCGNKAGLLKSTLADGQYICAKCSKPVPYELSKFMNEYDYEGFTNLLSYLEESNKEFGKMFRETHHFHGLHLDTEHGLFYLDSMFPRIYFLMSEVNKCELDYRPETIKEGFLGDKVTGDVHIKLGVDFPYIFMDNVLARNVKASATTKGVFNKKVLYDNPKGMDTFYIAFLDCWESAVKKSVRELEQLKEELRALRENAEDAE